MTHDKRARAKSEIDELESLARAGQFDRANDRLRRMNIKRIPRQEAVAYGNLARRLGLGKLSLRILNPIVRDRSRSNPATAEERIEYAASLRSLGAVSESTEILSGIDQRLHPKAGLHLALCLITEWRYAQAIPVLRSYLRSFKGASYSVYIGQVNLLAALIHEGQLDEARGLIREILREIDSSEFGFLYRRTLELGAQLEIAGENWEAALSHLEQVRSFASHAQDAINVLLVSKWLAIISSIRSRRVTPDLLRVQEQAVKLGQWETVRDCDFHIAGISGDRGALLRVYFGTPYESYRRKVLAGMGSDCALPDRFLWSAREARPKLVFDLLEGRCATDRASLTPGQALHRLMIVLCQDFYRPMPLLSIFSRLFPSERFDPDSSANRVHQLIWRFRRWIDDNSLPLRLEEKAETYRLLFTGALAISIPRDPPPLGQRELEFHRLMVSLGQMQFTAKDALRAIGGSKTNVHRLLKWAVQASKLKLEGWGSSARYRFIA